MSLWDTASFMTNPNLTQACALVLLPSATPLPRHCPPSAASRPRSCNLALLAILDTHFRRNQRRLEALVRQGVQKGEFRAGPAKETAITVMALVEGLTLLWFLNPQMIDLGAQEEAVRTLLLQGLLRSHPAS